MLPPVIMSGYWPKDEVPRDVFSLLYFTEGAFIAIDGRSIEGEPYQRDIWRQSIGGDRSSSVFALAETFVDLVEAPERLLT